MGVAAADHWSEVTGRQFADASYHHPTDPLDRVLAYVDIQGAFILAKATGSAAIAADSIDHLRRYIASPFDTGTPQSNT